ncbi:class I SAM-dependent methyltransferase [Streptomyces sp. NPDC057908]|uniref:class I SAM-dependent methyltransferase n=1 Tax=Streptomyces sp. NPDC057908 TaxID=3346276 RepID=UPI0036EED281
MTSRLAPPRDLFAGTAEHYIRYRSQYPHAALDEIARASLPLGGRVLDMGSGPGTIAIALAERGLDVTAVDPSPDMLVAGSRDAEQRGVRLQWLEGDSEHLPEVTGVATVTIGDAFHWMAPHDKFLQALDQMVEPAGLLAVLSRRAPGAPRPAWHTAISEVQARYLHDDPQAAAHGYRARVEADTISVLRRSPFSRIREFRFRHMTSATIEEVVGRQYTRAFSSPALLGDRLPAFDRDLHAALQAAEPSGAYLDTTESQLLLAER